MDIDDDTECKAGAGDSNGTSSDLNHQALTILRKTLEMCRIECEGNKLALPLMSYEERFKLYTGYSITVLPEEKMESDKNTFKNFDIHERITIIKSLLSFYLEKKAPTMFDAYRKLKTVLSVSYDQFCAHMYMLGFNYLPTTTAWIVCEDPKLRFERFHYLNKIKKYRQENKAICYIDERIIKNEGNTEKIDMQLTNQVDDGVVFLSAISNAEVICSLFCNNLSKDLFKKWIFSVLVKVIKPDTVIVFNNSKLHGELTQTTMTQHHSKQDMLKWLRFNNIPCNQDMQKAELYELTQRIPKDDKSYDIDKFLQGFDCNVLRLPFKCNNLSITELMWNGLETKNVFENKQPFVISDLLLPRIGSLLQERWKQYENIIINWENEMFNLDSVTEAALDNAFKFDVDKITLHCSNIL